MRSAGKDDRDSLMLSRLQLCMLLSTIIKALFPARININAIEQLQEFSQVNSPIVIHIQPVEQGFDLDSDKSQHTHFDCLYLFVS
jgi:hypothetical protein